MKITLNITNFSSMNMLCIASLTSGVFPIPTGDNQINEKEGVALRIIEIKKKLRITFMWSGGVGERQEERVREREKNAMNNIIIISRTGPPQHARKLYQRGCFAQTQERTKQNNTRWRAGRSLQLSRFIICYNRLSSYFSSATL